MIEAGEVGEPVSAVLQSRDPDAPPFEYVKGGGGLFKDMGESGPYLDALIGVASSCRCMELNVYKDPKLAQVEISIVHGLCGFLEGWVAVA